MGGAGLPYERAEEGSARGRLLRVMREFAEAVGGGAARGELMRSASGSSDAGPLCIYNTPQGKGADQAREETTQERKKANKETREGRTNSYYAELRLRWRRKWRCSGPLPPT